MGCWLLVAGCRSVVTEQVSRFVRRLPDGWEQRLNKMDEVWVPSAHSRAVFEAGGVAADRLFVVRTAMHTITLAQEGWHLSC